MGASTASGSFGVGPGVGRSHVQHRSPSRSGMRSPLRRVHRVDVPVHEHRVRHAVRQARVPEVRDEAQREAPGALQHMKTARELLRLLTERFPPPEGRHHALSIYADGKLHLMLHRGERWHDVVFEDDDLVKDPSTSVEGIAALLP